MFGRQINAGVSHLYLISRIILNVKTFVNELRDICGDNWKGKVDPKRAVLSPEGFFLICLQIILVSSIFS